MEDVKQEDKKCGTCGKFWPKQKQCRPCAPKPIAKVNLKMDQQWVMWLEVDPERDGCYDWVPRVGGAAPSESKMADATEQ